MGPAGICNVCGRACCTLDEAGIPCYHCFEGLFIHRQFWIYRACPECGGVGRTLCGMCNKVGCLAIAKETELDVDALWHWLIGLRCRYRRSERLPEAVASAIAYAEAQLSPDHIGANKGSPARLR